MTLTIALGCLMATAVGVAALYWAAGRVAAAADRLVPVRTSTRELHLQTRELRAAVDGRLDR